MQAPTKLKEHFDRYRPELSRSELAVAEHFLATPIEVLIFLSAEEIAAETGTSDATVIRTAKRLGFSGLPELKRVCSRDMAKTIPTTARLEQRFRATGDELAKVARHMFSQAREALTSTEEAVDGDALAAAVDLLIAADTVWCLGMGTSEAVAKHCATAISRAGKRSRASGASGFALANEILDLRSGDVVVMFHTPRDVPELRMVVEQISEIGCKVILISGVQLRPSFKDRVSVMLVCVGVPSKLASWNLGATVLSDLLAYGIAVRSQEQALSAKARLSRLRQQAGGHS